MAKSLNQCQFIGNLGKEPESRSMPNGDVTSTFSIAVADSYKDKSGQMVDKTEWVRVVAFGKLAEICNQYLKKGSKVFISGKLKQREYESQGVKKYVTEIVLENMQMLDGKQDSGAQAQPAQQQRESPRQQPPAPPASSFDDFEDDIPFK